MTTNARPEVPRDHNGAAANHQRAVNSGSLIRLCRRNPPHTGRSLSFKADKPVNDGRQWAALPIPHCALLLAGAIQGQAIAPVLVVVATVVELGMRKR